MLDRITSSWRTISSRPSSRPWSRPSSRPSSRTSLRWWPYCGPRTLQLILEGQDDCTRFLKRNLISRSCTGNSEESRRFRSGAAPFSPSGRAHEPGENQRDRQKREQRREHDHTCDFLGLVVPALREEVI